MESYFASQKDHIFKGVEVLIYVFDVESKEVRVLFWFSSPVFSAFSLPARLDRTPVKVRPESIHVSIVYHDTPLVRV
jgi:Gtr1/RagA G-like protein